MEKLNQAAPELSGLNDFHLKAVAYFAQEILGIKYYEIAFDLAKKPKEIRLLVRSADGRPIRFKLKRPELLDQLATVLQLPEYVVKIPVDGVLEQETDGRADS